MDAYPPGPELGLYKACQVFQDDESETLEKIANFFQLLKDDAEWEEEYPALLDEEDKDCFDL